MCVCVCLCVISSIPQSYMLVEGAAVPLIPQVSVPLNSTECACQSFEELAAITFSPVEHDCRVVENCRGVECELDVFGSIYYIEYLVDPCGDDVVIDYIIYNDEMEALVVESFNETTSTIIVVDGTPIPVEHTLIRHDYSIEVEVSSTDPLYISRLLHPTRNLTFTLSLSTNTDLHRRSDLSQNQHHSPSHNHPGLHPV